MRQQVDWVSAALLEAGNTSDGFCSPFPCKSAPCPCADLLAQVAINAIARHAANEAATLKLISG